MSRVGGRGSEDGGRRSEVGGQGLDAAIDRAVREMLSVEPPPGLRGRVLDRIESPRRSIGWIWIAGPVAAAAVILVAVLASWRHSAQPEPPAGPSIAKVEQNLGSPPVLQAPKFSESPNVISIPVRSAPAPGEQPSRHGVEARLLVAAVAPATDDASGVDPLTPIVPITVPAVRPADIAHQEIAIGPLAPIGELQVAPLSPPERRN